MIARIPFSDQILNSQDLLTFQTFDVQRWESLGDKFSHIVSMEDKGRFAAELDSIAVNLSDLKGKRGNFMDHISFWDQGMKEY